MSVKMGRPPNPPIVLTEEQLELAIDMATKGEPLKRIITAICVSEYHFYRYKQDNLEFNKNFEQARQEGLEHVADDLMTLADDYQDVQRARLKSDNYKWLLSKRKPAVYGDKVDIHVSQTIDIGAALSDARARIVNQLPKPSTDNIIDLDVSETKNVVGKSILKK